MSYKSIYSILGLMLWTAASARPQITLDSQPARTFGRPAAELTSVANTNPNLGTSIGLYSPQGIAVDTTGSSPILYVADTSNNRVLAWKNATSSTLQNLQQPDKIIGQPNATTTLPGINGTGNASGLYYPTGLVVDAKGNLYIADAGNNRILRYPAPFSGSNNGGNPDLVLGQPDPFTSRHPNQGGNPGANTIFLANLPSTIYFVSLAFDSSGNLYVTDVGNNRILRYPASTLTSGNFDPNADIVLGQGTFTTLAAPNGPTDRNHFYSPAGLAFDTAGHLFTTDGAGRMLVFTPPFTTGMAAIRIAGIVSPAPATATASTMLGPNGIVMINNGPAVVDSGDNRILVFDAFSSSDWTVKSGDNTESQPAPVSIPWTPGGPIGQPNFSTTTANSNNPQASASTLSNPVSAAVAGTDLFVADAGNNRVLVFPNLGQGGNATVVLGQSNFAHNSVNAMTGEGFWFYPGISPSGDSGLAVDNTSNPPHLYVADPGNNRVLGFSNAYSLAPGVAPDLVLGQPDFFTSVCNYGGVRPQKAVPFQPPQQPTASSLCYPTGLSVDPGTGDLYVADSLNGRVVRFPHPFQSGATNLESADLVLGQAGFTGLKNPSCTQSVMQYPYGVLYDPQNGLLVSDTLNPQTAISCNRVLLFSKNGLSNSAPAAKVIGQPDFTSTGTSVLSQPHHIAEDSNARVYVADSNHGQVLIFGSLTDLATSTTVSLNALTNLNYPQAVWVNPASVAGYPDDIWTGDFSNGALRFSRFALLGAEGTNQPTTQIYAATLSAGQSALCAAGGGDCPLSVLAITQDGAGNLYIADSSNRVGIHYQALASRNGANYICAMGCDVLNELSTYNFVAPGSIAILAPFSVDFGGNAANYTGPFPVPTTFQDRQVLVNNTPSPIFYASTNQINFMVPSSAPPSGTARVEIVQPSTGQILGSGSLGMNTVAPGMFTANEAGTAQVLALNQDNSRNGPTGCAPTPCGPATRGTVLQIFGTGQGVIPGMPPDGQPPSGVVSTPQMPAVFIGGFQVPSSAVQFSGLSPCCAGLWQINVQIPTSTAPGTSVSLLVEFENQPSFHNPANGTTIAVQ